MPPLLLISCSRQLWNYFSFSTFGFSTLLLFTSGPMNALFDLSTSIRRLLLPLTRPPQLWSPALVIAFHSGVLISKFSAPHKKLPGCQWVSVFGKKAAGEGLQCVADGKQWITHPCPDMSPIPSHCAFKAFFLFINHQKECKTCRWTARNFRQSPVYTAAGFCLRFVRRAAQAGTWKIVHLPWDKEVIIQHLESLMKKEQHLSHQWHIKTIIESVWRKLLQDTTFFPLCI